jgi:hypothetical protein
LLNKLPIKDIICLEMVFFFLQYLETVFCVLHSELNCCVGGCNVAESESVQHLLFIVPILIDYGRLFKIGWGIKCTF